MILLHFSIFLLVLPAFYFTSITDFDIEYINTQDSPHFKTFHLPINITVKENGCFEQVPLSENIGILIIKTENGFIKIVPQKDGQLVLGVKLSIFTSNMTQNYTFYDLNIQNEALYNAVISPSQFTFGNNISNTYSIGSMFSSTNKVEIAFFQYYLNPCEIEVEITHNYVSAKKKNQPPRRPKKPPSCTTDYCDWQDFGAVTPVKNQGTQCNGCWAFAVVTILESFYFRQHGTRINFSEQWLLDCGHHKYRNALGRCFDYGAMRVSGGNVEIALKAVEESIGMRRSENYKYTGNDNEENCPDEEKEFNFRHQYTVVKCQQKVEKIKEAIMDYGPVIAHVQVSGAYFDKHVKGIYRKTCTSGESHAVPIVGFGKDGDEEYWIIKNSWGKKFKDKGYLKLLIRKNGINSDCGIKLNVFYLKPTNEHRIKRN